MNWGNGVVTRKRSKRGLHQEVEKQQWPSQTTFQTRLALMLVSGELCLSQDFFLIAIVHTLTTLLHMPMTLPQWILNDQLALLSCTCLTCLSKRSSLPKYQCSHSTLIGLIFKSQSYQLGGETQGPHGTFTRDGLR